GLFLGTGISDYLDIIANGEQSADIVNRLTTFDCQAWDLQQLRPSSPILQTKTPGGWSDNVEDQDPSVVLALDDLDDILSTHFRKKLRYYRRSLEREGEVSFEEASAENLDRLLDALFALHAARWQRRGMPGMLADDVVQNF